MDTLPTLVSSFGRYRLPLANATAEMLVDALVCRDPQRRRARFQATLAGDPAFAVWALVAARQSGSDSFTTCSALADWLATQPAATFRPERDREESCEESPLAEYSEPAGCSLAVAELAELFARHVSADGERAYFLGLVHLAPAWLAESAVEGETASHTGQSLPHWVTDAMSQISLPANEQPPEITCVSRAIELVCSDKSDQWRAMGCDAARWIGRWAQLGEAWGQTGKWAERLVDIGTLLDAYDGLRSDFDHALETAKLEAMKELAYGAGHEINNPLANISARAQTLLQDETDPERRRTLAAINTQALRAHEMIADMMLFARPPKPHPEACSLESLLHTLVAELAPRASDQEVSIRLHIPDAAISVSADPTQIAVAVRSLLVNSLDALVGGGQIELTLQGVASDASSMRICVSDNGPGIPPDVRDKIFDPFYSGREAGRGLGLGLSKCWQIVTMHGGRIDVGDRQGGGRDVYDLAAVPRRLSSVVFWRHDDFSPHDLT